MPTEDNKTLVRREFEEMLNQEGNLDAAEEIYAPNYVGHAPPFGDIPGIEGAKQSAVTYRQAFPDLQTTIEDMVAEGDKIVVRYRGSGTHEGDTEAFGPPTGKADGDNGYYHPATLRGQAGGSPDQLRRLGLDAAAWDDPRTGAGRQLGFLEFS